MLAVVLAVSAVLVFLKTRVQPPSRLSYTNQYIDNLRHSSEQVGRMDDSNLEREFLGFVDRIDFMKNENLITNEEYIGCFEEFVNAYIPAFRKWCDRQFDQPVWPNKTLQFMRTRINEVRRYNETVGYGPFISDENEAHLNEVDKILKDYNGAWKLSKVSIRSKEDSRKNLAKARQYRQDAYLSKCTALTKMLDNLPSRYQKSHYEYVNSLVKGLDMAHYPSATQVTEWATNYKKAKAAIADYNSAAEDRNLYHTSSSDFNLNTYYQRAKEGFWNKISPWDPYEVRSPYEQTFGVRL